jgi:hypothetical protein
LETGSGLLGAVIVLLHQARELIGDEVTDFQILMEQLGIVAGIGDTSANSRSG